MASATTLSKLFFMAGGCSSDLENPPPPRLRNRLLSPPPAHSSAPVPRARVGVAPSLSRWPQRGLLRGCGKCRAGNVYSQTSWTESLEVNRVGSHGGESRVGASCSGAGRGPGVPAWSLSTETPACTSAGGAGVRPGGACSLRGRDGAPEGGGRAPAPPSPHLQLQMSLRSQLPSRRLAVSHSLGLVSGWGRGHLRGSSTFLLDENTEA